MVGQGKARVVDLCCGVGMSTRALQNAFPNAEAVVGVDTSKEMLAMARFMTEHLAFMVPLWNRVMKFLGRRGVEYADGLSRACGRISFAELNAEDTKLPEHSFDLVTIMYGFHEAPRAGRDKILREARRILKQGGKLAVIDISTDYQPSRSMLAGEPYVKEYQENIVKQLKQFKGFRLEKSKTIIPNHLNMWVLTRKAASAGP
jgi:ubiquinone/menaquinone biosynthesis C-methylase UbiE